MMETLFLIDNCKSSKMVLWDCREFPFLAKNFSSAVKNMVISGRKSLTRLRIGGRQCYLRSQLQGRWRSQTSDFRWPCPQNMAHIHGHIHSPQSHHIIRSITKDIIFIVITSVTRQVLKMRRWIYSTYISRLTLANIADIATTGWIASTARRCYRI